MYFQKEKSYIELTLFYMDFNGEVSIYPPLIAVN